MRQLALNAANRVLYGRVNLILHGTVTGPARRHFLLPKVIFAYTPDTSYLCIPGRVFSSLRLPNLTAGAPELKRPKKLFRAAFLKSAAAQRVVSL